MKLTLEHRRKISDALKGKKRSKEHCENISKSAIKRLSNSKNNPNYRGDNVGYSGIHGWLVKTFGHATYCENCKIKGKKKNNKWTISYCLKKGCKYKRERDLFIMMCVKCHRNYDKTDTWNKNISKSMKKHYQLLDVSTL